MANPMITLSGFCDEASPDPAVQIDVARRAGLSHLDVRMVGETNIADLSAEACAPFAVALAEAGLSVGCLGSAIGKTDLADDFAIDQRRIDRIAGHADVLGCRRVRVFSSFNRSGLDAVAWRAGALDRLAQLKARAAELGLVLLLENERHLYGDRLNEMRDLAEQLAEPGVLELIFDFDNFNQSGDDVLANWQALRQYVTCFHLKDSTNEKVHVPIGEGAGQARAILTDAAEAGWSGLLSLEPHLAHSSAVLATGPSGTAAMQDRDPVDAFLHGAAAAQALLKELNIDYR